MATTLSSTVSLVCLLVLKTDSCRLLHFDHIPQRCKCLLFHFGSHILQLLCALGMFHPSSLVAAALGCHLPLVRCLSANRMVNFANSKALPPWIMKMAPNAHSLYSLDPMGNKSSNAYTVKAYHAVCIEILKPIFDKNTVRNCSIETTDNLRCSWLWKHVHYRLVELHCQDIDSIQHQKNEPFPPNTRTCRVYKFKSY